MRYFAWLLIPGLLVVLWAQWRLQSAWRRWSKEGQAKACPLTGAETARNILDAADLAHVSIERTSGFLTDHYDPQTRTLRLSTGVHDQVSLAAVGIAAHEAAHALQHRELYWPMQARLALLPFTRLGAWLALPLLALGLALRVPPLMLIGVGLFVVLLLFQLVTLPLEFDASRRAGWWLRERRLVSPSELEGVGQVLHAAAWTYLAAFAMSFLHILRWMRLLRSPF